MSDQQRNNKGDRPDIPEPVWDYEEILAGLATVHIKLAETITELISQPKATPTYNLKLYGDLKLLGREINETADFLKPKPKTEAPS